MTAQSTQAVEAETPATVDAEEIGPDILGETATDDENENAEADWPVEDEPDTREPSAGTSSSQTGSDRGKLMTFDDLIPGEITIDSALLFVGDQILYRYRDHGFLWRMKFLSPAAVRAAFDELPIDSGWLPSAVRRHGLHPRGNWAVMFIPPGRHTLRVQVKARTVDLTIPLPGLVFAGCGADYYLYAVTESEFSPQAELFYAPLSNLNGNGLICFGSNPMAACSVATMSHMWGLFVSSAFTAHHVDHRCKSYPDNVFLLLRKLAGKRKFPLGELLPAHLRVDQWIDRLTRHNQP